jgi:cytochrome P450
MSDIQLRDEAVTLLVAGHETTASALTWTLYMLSQYPEVGDRLQREVDEVLGDRKPTLEDLANLRYTRMVIDESLRLHPPGWLTFRKAEADDEIGGYHIPAGTTLTLSQWATHRHPEIWDDPESFDPERFSPERSKGRPPFAFFPFGGGPRLCIGSSFALLELQLVLPILVRRFTFELDQTRTVQNDPQVTLRPKGGLWMYIKQIP